jgi:hypothetical protein
VTGQPFVYLAIHTKARATLSPEAFDRDVGIKDMHIGDILWAISRKYLDIIISSDLFI